MVPAISALLRCGSIKLWGVATGKEVRTLTEHEGGASNVVAFSPDGQTLASGSEGIKLWHLASGQLLRTLAGHKGGVESVVFSPDGHTLASGCSDHTIKLWDVK